MELQKYDADKAALEQLASDYRNLVVTRENLKDADKARLTLKNARLSIQKVEKKNNDIINDLKKRNKSEADLFIQLVEPIEIRIENDIKGIEAEIEMEKRKEEQRVANLRLVIATIEQQTLSAATHQVISVLESWGSKNVPENMQEFTDEWIQKDAVLKQVCADRIEFLKLKEKEQREAKEREATRIDQIAKQEVETTVNSAAQNLKSVVETRVQINALKPEISKSMGVDTKPAHKLVHLGYWIQFDPSMSVDIFTKCANAIREVLDGEDLL